jgi:DNA-directed RNA polymerase beta subunit
MYVKFRFGIGYLSSCEMGIHSTLCEDGAAEHVFDGLRASVFEAYQAWRSLPAKHHDDFHAFCDSLPNDVMRVSPYCIVNNAKDPRVLKMIAWDYEFVDIDFSPEMMRVDVINSDKNAMETEDEVSATTSQFVFFKQTPQHARENLNNYIIHVRVRMRRRVFTTDANLDEHIRKSVKDRIDSEKRVGDNGCWLISNFDIGRWPLLTQHLKYRPNYSGYQGVRGGNDIYRIAVPRLTGTRGCVLSPEVRKHYTLEDYCRIMEDPSDPTGYFIVKGQEKTWRLEKVAPFNQITVLLGKKSGAAQRRVKALIWVHTATMDPFDKAPCWVSIATLLGPNGTCWEQQQQQKSNATLKRLMAEHNTGKQKSKKERILEEKNLHILFHASWLRGRLPLPVIFYALGICSDKEVIVLMGGTLTSLQKDRNNHFEKCAVATIAAARLTCGIEFTTNNSRMQHLAQRRIVKSTNFEHDYVKKHVKEDTVQFMFENYVLRTRLLAHIAPHAGPMPQPTVNSQIRQHRFLRQEQLEINPTFMTSIYGSNSVRLKLLTLSSMCTRAMLCVCGHIEPDDRDSDEHKRVRGLNLYMRHQFTIGLRHALKLAVGQQLRIYKKRKWNLNDSTLLDFPDSGFKFTVVTDKLVYMLSTGNCKMGAKFRNGCTQRTDRSTRLATLAQLRNLHAGGNGEEHSRDTKRRALRTNHWGVECALETPEGLSCGLTTSLACTAFISLRLSAQDEMQIYDFITKSPLIFHICNAATTTTDPLLTNMEMDSYLNVAVTGDNDVTDMDVELFGMVKETTPSNRPNGVMPRFQVHINAICVGFCHVTDIAGICESIDDFRRQKMTFCGVSVSYNLDNYTVSILTDNDRFMRPIFVVTGGEENRIPVERNVALIMSGGNVADQRMLSWPYFWHTGTVDLIGVDKEQNAMIATTPKDLYATRPCGYPTPLCPPLAAARIAAVSCANMVALAATGIAAAVALVALTMAQAVVERSPKKLLCRETNKIKRYTNAEIDPTVILGVNGGDVWFVSHAPSPRESYQIGHAKQASDVALFNNRFATSRGRTLELFYPQQPLVMTHGMAMTKSNQNPNGQNLVVAFICDPYAQEDAIVFNQHSIDRGLLRKLLTECFTETETRGKVGQQIGQVRICNPNMKSLGKVITTSEQTRNDMRKMNVCPWRADGLPAIGEIIAVCKRKSQHLSF